LFESVRNTAYSPSFSFKKPRKAVNKKPQKRAHGKEAFDIFLGIFCGRFGGIGLMIHDDPMGSKHIWMD